MTRSLILITLFLTSKIINCGVLESVPLIATASSIQCRTFSFENNPCCNVFCNDENCIKCDSGMCSFSVLASCVTAAGCIKSEAVRKTCGVLSTFACGAATLVGCFYYCKTDGESEETSTTQES